MNKDVIERESESESESESDIDNTNSRSAFHEHVWWIAIFVGVVIIFVVVRVLGAF